MTTASRAATATLLDMDLGDETATQALAARLAAAVRSPAFIALRGDLGAGKTTLARSFIRALPGVSPHEDVPSPTFTLVQTYESDGATVWHFDLYRIEHPSELRELGWDDAVDEGICLVEWPEKAGRALPGDRLEIEITRGANESARHVKVIALGAAIEEYEGVQLG